MCHEYSSNHQWKLNYYTRVSHFREIIKIYCLRAPTYICIWWRNKNQCLDVKTVTTWECLQTVLIRGGKWREWSRSTTMTIEEMVHRLQRAEYSCGKKCHTLCYGEPVIIHHCTPLLWSNPRSRYPYLCSSTYILKTTSFKPHRSGKNKRISLKIPTLINFPN